MAGCQHRVTVLVDRQFALHIEVISTTRAHDLIEGNCEHCGADIEIEFIRHVGEEVKHATN